MKILTICQGGNSRSVAMAYVLKYRYEIDSLACSWEKNSKETLNMLFNWADYIFTMETEFIKYIPDEFKHKVLSTDVGIDRWFSIRDDLIKICNKLITEKMYEIKKKDWNFE